MSRRKSLFEAWLALATDSMALMQGSAFVIGKRTEGMASAGPNPPAAHQREMQRMVEEKVSASAEAWTRTAMASASVFQSMAAAAVLGRPLPSSTQLQRGAIKVLGAAAAPYRTRVKSNVRRLARKK